MAQWVKDPATKPKKSKFDNCDLKIVGKELIAAWCPLICRLNYEHLVQKR